MREYSITMSTMDWARIRDILLDAEYSVAAERLVDDINKILEMDNELSVGETDE